MLYLARHGQDQDNANGILNGRRNESLTDIGLSQAKVLAQKIKELELGITAIVSSPLQRAYKTAEIISDELNIPKPFTSDLLIERDFGCMTGQKIADVVSLCTPDILETDTVKYFLKADGAETFPELLNRAKEALSFIEQTYSNEIVLLVCHGDIGKMIYAAYYNLDWKEVLSKFHFGNSEVLLLEHDSKPEDRHVHKTEQFNH